MPDHLEDLKVVILNQTQVIYIEFITKNIFIFLEIPSGRIIGSTNVFWRQFIDPQTKLLKTRDEISEGYLPFYIIE